MSFGGKRVIFEKQSLILHSLEGKKKAVIPLKGKYLWNGAA